MSNVSQLPIPASADDEASEWLVKLDADDVSPDDQAEFQQWLTGGPHRQRAFDRLNRDWQMLDELSALRGPDGSAIDPDRTQAWLREEYPNKQARRRWLPVYGAAAAAAAVLLAVLIPSSLPTTDHMQTYQTAVGQRSTYALPDGSTMELNTDSVIKVEFSEGQRRIRLARGEAYFDVAHDTDRPFIVVSEDTSVRAVGTAFTVRQRAGVTEVTVTEGRVRVTPTAVATNNRHKPFTIGPGSHAEVGAASVTSVKLQPGVIDRDLAWRKGMLAFKGESLEEVIGEVGRYTDKQIRFADDDIRDLEVGGYFQVDDVDSVLDMVAASFSIKVEYIENDIILLSKSVSDDEG